MGNKRPTNKWHHSPWVRRWWCRQPRTAHAAFDKGADWLGLKVLTRGDTVVLAENDNNDSKITL
jgi:hypothetical protein